MLPASPQRAREEAFRTQRQKLGLWKGLPAKENSQSVPGKQTAPQSSATPSLFFRVLTTERKGKQEEAASRRLCAVQCLTPGALRWAFPASILADSVVGKEQL